MLFIILKRWMVKLPKKILLVPSRIVSLPFVDENIKDEVFCEEGKEVME